MSSRARGAEPGTTEVASFCRICNAMCGILVTTRGDQVLSVRGDPDHPLSRGYTCPKGRALAAFHHHPERLDHPTLGTREVGWDTAIGDLAATMRQVIEESGPDAVGMYLASGSAFDAAGRRAAERFLHVLGSRQKYTATTIDTPCKPLVAELVGGWSGLTPVWDHERSSMLVLVGCNPVVSHGHSNAIPDPVRRLREMHARGGEVWVADPRRTETAALADRHLALRPSTDHVLLGHLVRELLRDGADHDFLRAHATGVDALAEAVEPYTSEVTARRTGLAAQDVADLVAAVRRHGRVAALTGTGCSMSAAANLTEWFLWALHAVTGSTDRPGGMWFNPGYLFQLDTREWHPSDGAPEPGPASRPELPRRFGEYPCAALADEIDAGNLRVLVVVGGNPMTALPDAAALKASLGRLDALAVIDVVRTETTELATHLLPAAGQLERADVPWLLDAYQLAVATQFTPAVVPPARQRRPAWWILAQLGDQLGVRVLPRGVDGAQASDHDVLAPVAEASRGGAETVFAARSGVVHEPAVFGWVTERVLPAGRLRLAPAPLLEQLAQLEGTSTAATPTADPTRPCPDGDPPEPGTLQLSLVPHRQLRTMNSQLRDTASPGGRTEDVHLALAPDDAATIGVQAGQAVTVTAIHTGASVTGRVRTDPRLRPGTATLPHGWSDPNVCALTSATDGVDPLTGMVWQSGVPVLVRLTP